MLHHIPYHVIPNQRTHQILQSNSIISKHQHSRLNSAAIRLETIAVAAPTTVQGGRWTQPALAGRHGCQHKPPQLSQRPSFGHLTSRTSVRKITAPNTEIAAPLGPSRPSIRQSGAGSGLSAAVGSTTDLRAGTDPTGGAKLFVPKSPISKKNHCFYNFEPCSSLPQTRGLDPTRPMKCQKRT